MSDQDGFLPQSRPATDNNEFNALSFLMKQMMAQMNTATLVKVIAVYGGGTAAVGTVDIQPLVQQTDGAGKPIDHDVIYEVPYFRLQGGTNAVIVDPEIGDIGFCVFCQHDISLVQASGATNLPGSQRRFNMADALYIGGWNTSVAPTSYVMITGTDITIVNATAIDATTPTFTIHGNLHVTGTVQGDQTGTFTGDVTGNGTSLHTHIHTGGTIAGNTGAPV